jgi:hypothetical protein
MLSGLVLLFLGGLIAGHLVFTPEERSLALSHQVSQAEQVSPEAAKALRKRNNIRKIRLALSSFDLVAGFTSRELEAIPTFSLTFPFFYLLACFWLILGLRKPGRD